MATATAQENAQLSSYKEQAVAAANTFSNVNANNNDLNINVELDHTIGFSITCSNPLHFLQTPPIATDESQIATQEQIQNSNNSNDNFDYCNIAGASILMNQFNNPQNQTFLRGHSDIIAACDMSQNKQLLATAQSGQTPDVYIWNLSTKQVIYKLEEHSAGVDHVAFSDDSVSYN